MKPFLVIDCLSDLRHHENTVANQPHAIGFHFKIAIFEQQFHASSILLSV